MKNILVIGGAGFIGSNLCSYLSSLGLNVTSLDNYSTGTEKNHVDGVHYINGDARYLIAHSMPSNIDTVFHLGEYSRVEQSFDEPFDSINGICGTIMPVIEFCYRVNAKLVYCASSSKFGDAWSPYAMAKSINTDMVRSFCSNMRMKYAITYFYNVYGENEPAHGKYATVFAKFLKAKQNNEPVIVNSPGTQKRNFTYVRDIISALYLIAKYGIGDNFGIGSQEQLSILQLADLIGVEYNLGGCVKGNRTESKLVCNKTKSLGWRPIFSLYDYIKQHGF